MSVVHDMIRAYGAPRRVFRARLLGAEREVQALVILMAACLLIFVAQAPRLQRLAIETDQEFQPLMGGALFGWLFIMPLVAYAMAAISHGIARIMRGTGTFFGARLALFWALLVASPLWLLWGLTAGFVGEGPTLSIVGAIALGAFLVHWIVNLITAERMGAPA